MAKEMAKIDKATTAEEMCASLLAMQKVAAKMSKEDKVLVKNHAGGLYNSL